MVRRRATTPLGFVETITVGVAAVPRFLGGADKNGSVRIVAVASAKPGGMAVVIEIVVELSLNDVLRPLPRLVKCQ